MTADVIIVGAGLAGSATALGLARHGLRVVLVDKRQFPRDKPCGEGLLPHGVRELAALGLGDIVTRCQGQPFAGIIYRCDGCEAIGRFVPGHVGFGMRRLTLDAAVHAQAVAQPNVRAIYANTRAVEIHAQGAAITLDNGERLHARALVGADGARSLVRRSVGLDAGVPRAGRWALRQHFELRPGAAMPGFVEVSLHPGFELYVTPSAPGIIGIAALCERQTMRQLEGMTRAEKLRRLIEQAPADVQERLRGAHTASDALACGPMRARARAVSQGPVLLVGDAAGYVDAITGEGMSLALCCSNLAVSALDDWLNRGADRDNTLHTYARLRQQRVRAAEFLTHATVWMTRRPQLAHHVTARLARFPDTFTRLLSVLHGEPLRTLQARDVLRLAI